MKRVPYISGSMMTGVLPPTVGAALIRTAYQSLYNSEHPPEKFVSGSVPKMLWMPYRHSEDGYCFEKTLFIDPTRRPGVWGHAILSAITSSEPQAVFDATALTGIRTAAKSVLFAILCFTARKQIPASIVIYGASTQAMHHALQFHTTYPSARIYIMTRSALSCRNIEKTLSQYWNGYQCVMEEKDVLIAPDILVATTSSTTPVITETNIRSAQLLIAVGSSNADVSEIAPTIVSRYRCIVDAAISVAGKGELAISLRSGSIQATDIMELKDFLDKDARDIAKTPHLFVSKGLVIEDYVVARWFLQHFGI